MKYVARYLPSRRQRWKLCAVVLPRSLVRQVEREEKLRVQLSLAGQRRRLILSSIRFLLSTIRYGRFSSLKFFYVVERWKSALPIVLHRLLDWHSEIRLSFLVYSFLGEGPIRRHTALLYHCLLSYTPYQTLKQY